jgi:hypothetical protein
MCRTVAVAQVHGGKDRLGDRRGVPDLLRLSRGSHRARRLLQHIARPAKAQQKARDRAFCPLPTWAVARPGWRMACVWAKAGE